MDLRQCWFNRCRAKVFSHRVNHSQANKRWPLIINANTRPFSPRSVLSYLMIINLISQLVFRSPAGLIYKTFSFVRCLCAPLFFLAFCASTVPKVSAQFYDSTKIVSEGGMIFAQRSQDTLRMSNSSVAGIRVAGSASAPGGGIKVGAASSEVLSELNPLFVSSGGIAGDLFVAGNQSDWESSAHSAR